MLPKHLIHERTHAVDIFIPDLHEDGPGIRQQIAGNGKAVAQIGQVAVDAVAPGVAEGFDLLGFAGDVGGVAILHVPAGGGPLEVAVELDAVGGIEINALDLAAQALALRKAGHDLERVAENHPVAPVLIVLVELGFVGAFGDAVEIGEEVGRELAGFVLALAGGAEEVVDEGFGVDLFLDVKGRGVDDEVAPVLLVLAAPHELGIEIGVARVADLFGVLLLVLEDGLELGGGDVPPFGLVVGERFDGFGNGGLFGHATGIPRR